MENKEHFIMTSDKHTAELLRSYGYPELPKSGDKWVFVNKAPVVFSSDDMKLNYTSMLTF